MPLFRSVLERRYWSLGGGLVLATWATLKWARVVANWLRDQGWLTFVMLAIFALAAAVVLGWVVWQRPRRGELAVLGLFGVLYVLAVRPLMARPEEALHFVQYGTIGGFFFAALEERRRARRVAAGFHTPVAGTGRWLTALSAWGLTVAAGWADEGIQYLLPERYYDLRDVGFNAAAGALAIAAMLSRSWVRARRRPGEDLV